MKIVYIADDGTQFMDEDDCRDYEFKTSLPWVLGVKFYDKVENMISADPFDEYTYNNMYYIDIPTKIDYDSFMEVAKYCGYCEYENIPGPGKWHFIDRNDYKNAWEEIV